VIPLLPTATDLFLRAQVAWSARAQPTYETFSLPCSATFLAAQCAPLTTARFIVRMTDGRTYAQTIEQPGAPAKVLLRGGYITGPAGAPLGFYRRVPAGAPGRAPPPNFAADPLRTIATVTAVDYAYRVRLAGEEVLHGTTTAHLILVPLRKPEIYALRDLWVALDSYEILRLVYEMPFDAATARITYEFAPAGTPPLWTIVHIAAATRSEAVSEDLRDIEFPTTEPDEDFVTGSSSSP
jgi:hypothetical protein